MAIVEKRDERVSVVPVDRGMHLLRYLSASDATFSPIAEVRQGSGSEGAIEIISAPGVPFSKLARPGSCLVIRAEQAGELVVTLSARSVGGSLDAAFRLESITSIEEVENWRRILSEEASPANSPDVLGISRAGNSVDMGSPVQKAGVSLLAHLSRRGDVLVSEGQWVGGPDAPSAVEGLELRFAKGSDVDVEMQVLIGVRQPRWTDWVKSGVFAGTRGRGLPITGFRLRLRGGELSALEMNVEGLFLGSMVNARNGREIEMISAAGDPLVGLKFAFRSGEKIVAQRSFPPAGRERGPRVRVFRASASGA